MRLTLNNRACTIISVFIIAIQTPLLTVSQEHTIFATENPQYLNKDFFEIKNVSI